MRNGWQRLGFHVTGERVRMQPNKMKEMMADPEKMQKAIDDAQAMMVKH